MSVPTLSILCVTRGEAHAWRFLQAMLATAKAIVSASVPEVEVVFAADGPEAERALEAPRYVGFTIARVDSAGYMESVLDPAVERCSGDYILRIDDDERCSPAMVEWLKSGAWSSEPAWAFATAALWGDDQHVLTMPELWPQYHTRLTVKARAGGRSRIHAPDSRGRGAIAPVILEHHKFLVKSLEERAAIAERYNRIQPGAGKPQHSTPELAYDTLTLAPLGDGTLREWAPNEIRRVPARQSPPPLIDITRAAAIEGWMLPSELEWLATHAARASCIVEIGSWKGRATRALGDHAAGVVYAVDHWRGEPSDPQALCSIEAHGRGADAVRRDFEDNLSDLIARGTVKPVVQMSSAAAAQFEQEGIRPDLVFIDGDHSEASCGADIDAWCPLMRSGGVLAGHDYHRNHMGVVRAVHARFGDRMTRHKTIWAVQL